MITSNTTNQKIDLFAYVIVLIIYCARAKTMKYFTDADCYIFDWHLHNCCVQNRLQKQDLFVASINFCPKKSLNYSCTIILHLLRFGAVSVSTTMRLIKNLKVRIRNSCRFSWNFCKNPWFMHRFVNKSVVIDSKWENSKQWLSILINILHQVWFVGSLISSRAFHFWAIFHIHFTHLSSVPWTLLNLWAHLCIFKWTRCMATVNWVK